MSESNNARPFKGDSIIAFPDDYIVIDIETTGLSPIYDHIIEISAIKYTNNVEMGTFSSLVRPEEMATGIYVDAFIEALTGITNDMLAKAPESQVVLSKFKDFIGDEILIGYNVGFDINFLYDNFERYLGCPLTNEWVNITRIFRKLHPELEHHRLVDMAEYYQIDSAGTHRAATDCMITKLGLDKMKSEISDRFSGYEEFCKMFKNLRTSYKHHQSIDRFNRSQKNLIESVEVYEGEKDPTNPLYQKVCVFTGALETMTRAAATQLVLNCGGECGKSVTRKTNYLILGNTDYCANIKDGKSNKQKMAEELKLNGQDIEIIPESVFLDMINE